MGGRTSQVKVHHVVHGMHGVGHNEPREGDSQSVRPDQGEQQRDSQAYLERADVVQKVLVLAKPDGTGE